MDTSKSRRVISAALWWFLVGYVAAWLQASGGRQAHHARTADTLFSLNRLVQKYARRGGWDDEAE